MNINKTFRKVWFSRLISILGTELTSFGVSVWIYTITGKATPMAIILLCSILPSIILGPFSGIICDRYNRKYVIIIADSFAALISLFILFYMQCVDFHFSIIAIFVFLSSVANTFDNNAYQSSITTLVKEDEIKTANGLNQIIDSLSSILSPVLAGILYSIIGLTGIIIIDIASYIVSLALFTQVHKNNFSNHNIVQARDKQNAREEITEGFRFIFTQKSLLILLVYFTMLNFFFNIATSMIEPLGLTIGNSIQLGLIKACGGIGVLCGSLFVTTHNFKMPFYKIITIGGICSGVALFFMGITPNYICVAFGRGIFSSIVPILSTLAGTLWMKRTPPQLQGRVFASRAMVLRCFMPLSYLLVGPLADTILPQFLQANNMKWLLTFLGSQATAYRMVFLCIGVSVIILTVGMITNGNFKKLT